jgi:hypothetical protein
LNNKPNRLRLRIAIPAVVLLLAALLFSTAVSAQSNENNNISYSNVPENIPESSPSIMDLRYSPVPIPISTPDSQGYGASNIPAEKTIQKGINYLSQWHWYRPDITTDEILYRDFAKFQKDGIKYISLPLYWYRLEGPTRGDFTGSNAYGDAFLANIKRVIEIANQYGIQTMVDIHTLWGSDGTWCTPAYVRDPVTNSRIELAIVRDDNMQQAFLDMFTHTVNYLKGTPGIWCWALNEPWYWPHNLDKPFNNIDQKENFITLFQRMKEISQTTDGHPFTVRFVSVHNNNDHSLKDIFSDDWKWDPRIFSTLDFVSFNAYLPATVLQEEWKEIIASEITGCINRGKSIWISEFGSSLAGSNRVAAFQYTLDFLKSLPIQGALGWMWRSDKDEVNPDPPNIGFNMCASSQTGLGNQKYDSFINTFR